MKNLFFVFLFLSCQVYSQKDIVAKEYFKNGEFKKALISYNALYNDNKGNNNYLLQLVKTYQQLEQYNQAETVLLDHISRITFPSLFVEIGYNYQLKNDSINADLYYNKAITSLDTNPNFAFSIGRYFENHSLLEQAIATYEKASALKPDLNFDVQLAKIYGDQGNIEKMFASYINFVEKNTSQLDAIKRALSEFINDNSDNESNILLRKILLKKIQAEPNLLWNEMLSWLFVQQRDYRKAFAQEKAIFSRLPESLQGIIDLALIAKDDNDKEAAIDMFNYLITNAQHLGIVLEAHKEILAIRTENAQQKDLKEIDQTYLSLFKTYGTESTTIELQVAYAHFLAFHFNDVSKAIGNLKASLKLPLSAISEARVKLELGDILVLQEKFNEALIYYTQIQRSIKNSTVSQEARFKVAKTSYYKGDFKWAESQLKILKSSTSQLIANDALDLKLLISDNMAEDSLQTALKLYAKADLYAFQNKPDEAIVLLNQVLKEHKTETIIDQALLKQAELFENKKEFDKAEANYLQIIANYKEDILADDAHYRLAELYKNKLNLPEKAKDLYESIIFNYQDSIYFVEARKKFRTLRGDAIN